MQPQSSAFITIAKAAEILEQTPDATAALATFGDLESVEFEGRLMVSRVSVEEHRARSHR